MKRTIEYRVVVFKQLIFACNLSNLHGMMHNLHHGNVQCHNMTFVILPISTLCY